MSFLGSCSSRQGTVSGRKILSGELLSLFGRIRVLLLLAHVVVGLPQSPPTRKRPWILHHHPWVSWSLNPRGQSGRGPPLGPMEMTGVGSWVSFQPGGAGAFFKGTTKGTFCPCPWPGVTSICFENLRQVLDSSGLVLLPHGFWLELGSPWGSWHQPL